MARYRLARGESEVAPRGGGGSGRGRNVARGIGGDGRARSWWLAGSSGGGDGTCGIVDIAFLALWARWEEGGMGEGGSLGRGRRIEL